LAHRENKAAELLFAESLKQIDRINQRHAMAGMFRTSTVTIAPPKEKPVRSAATTNMVTRSAVVGKNTVQQTMSSFLLDSMIVDEIKKKNRATAKKKAEAKEAKEKGTK
jgi:hypothetical protein